MQKKLIRKAAEERFSEFLTECGRAFPAYIDARYRKNFNPFIAAVNVFTLFVFGLLAVFFHRKSKSALFFFEGVRYPEIHALYPPDQVVIIGGIKDFRYARNKGYGFHWDGYVRKLFNIFYYLKWGLAFDVLSLIVRGTIGKQLGGKSRLFLFEDTVQVGLSLALTLKDITPVVCIAHGYFSRANDGFHVVCDGDLCAFNFIYEESQKDFYFRIKDGCFVLGLPYEIPELNGISKEIILVEQSTPDMPEEYIKCLNIMYSFAAILKECGYKFIYRLRPGSPVNQITKRFEAIHVGDKMELLGGARKIFVGFNSTLLYEAGAAGHVTIGLNDSDFAYTRIFKVDYFVPHLDKDVIGLVLNSAYKKLESLQFKKSESLKARFTRCLDQMDGIISRQY